MEKQKILEEIEKWKRIDEQRNINCQEIINIREAIKDVEYKMLQYFLKKYDNDSVLDTLRKKGVLNAKGELIEAKFLFSKKIVNLGYGRDRDEYAINPLSALLLYNAYLEFSEGKINNNIRKLNYANISYNELDNLNQYELIYWCFVHNITFEEFAKMNFIHECAHRFGVIVVSVFDDPYLWEIISEGITEVIARRFAKDENIPYIPIFRNMEFDYINHFYKDAIDDLIFVEVALWDMDIYGIEAALTCLFDLKERDAFTIENLANEMIGTKQEVTEEREANGTKIYADDSFITAISKELKREEDEQLIERTEAFLEDRKKKTSSKV